MTGATHVKPRAGWMGGMVAWLFLYVVMVAPLPWEPLSCWSAFASVNVDFLFVVCVGLALRFGFGNRWWATHFVVWATLFVPLYRFGHTLMPVYFDRTFVLFDDILLLPSLIYLVTYESSTLRTVGLSLGVLLAVAVLYWLTLLASRRVLLIVSRPWLAALCFGCAQVIALGYWVDRSVAPREQTEWVRASMLGAASDGLVQEVRSASWRIRERLRDERRDLNKLLSNVSGRVDGLQGADLYVVFIESMGRVAMEDARVRIPFEDLCAELEPKLVAANVASRSGWFTAGGAGSRGAHMQLMSGINIDGLRMYDAVLRSGGQTFAHYLSKSGYRTINVQPAVDVEWPQSSSALGFDFDLFRMRLPYEGWTYHWGDMPDQFALASLLQTEGNGDRPIFAQYISVTSHAPFRDIPKYYDDWQAALQPGAFDQPDHSYELEWSNYVGHPDQVRAYVDTIGYSLRTVAGLAMQLKRPGIVIALGDHPPPIPFDRNVDHSMDVPVFVFSNDEQLLAKFHSLDPGLVAPVDGLAVSTKMFLPWLLTEFDSSNGHQSNPADSTSGSGK